MSEDDNKTSSESDVLLQGSESAQNAESADDARLLATIDVAFRRRRRRRGGGEGVGSGG